MKPHTVFTVSRRILTETGSALLTVTVSETGEALTINHQMNGALSYAFFATKELTADKADYPKRRNGKCTASPTKGQNNGG